VTRPNPRAGQTNIYVVFQDILESLNIQPRELGESGYFGSGILRDATATIVSPTVAPSSVAVGETAESIECGNVSSPGAVGETAESSDCGDVPSRGSVGKMTESISIECGNFGNEKPANATELIVSPTVAAGEVAESNECGNFSSGKPTDTTECIVSPTVVPAPVAVEEISESSECGNSLSLEPNGTACTGNVGIQLNPSISPEDDSDLDSVDCDEDSDEGIFVEVYDSYSARGKRSWAKDHCCIFCQKYISKMARHLTDCHRTEPEVVEAMSLPLKSAERRQKFEHLMCVGDYYHNIAVLESGHGHLIVLRRPTGTECSMRSIQPRDYTPCPGCLGFVKKSDLWRHSARCRDFRHSNGDIREPRAAMQASKLLIFPIVSMVSLEFATEVIGRMLQDEVSEVANTDWLITQLGSFMFKQYSCSQRQLISTRMRLLARLLIEVRRITGNDKLALDDCISPDFMDSIIEAVHCLCQIQSSRNARPSMGCRPSFALKIGHEMRRCAELVRNFALKRHDRDTLRKADDFLEVRKYEWPKVVSGHALSTLHRRKQNKPDMLPCTTDIMLLVKHLKGKMTELEQEIEAFPSARVWHQLSELTLARIIVFNKRRSGEVARMTLQNYLERPKWHSAASEEFRAVFTPLEKKLADTMELVKIPAKRGTTASVLLTVDMVSALNSLNTYRQQFLSVDTPYLFANELSCNGEPLRGHECVRKAALAAGVSHPERITGTKLRKYLATVSQIFELKEGEVDWLARHLSHDIRVHRDYYKLHDSSIELAKVSKLLLAVDNGKPGQWKGKQLDEIDLEMIGLSDSDIGLSGDSDAEVDDSPKDLSAGRTSGPSAPSGIPCSQCTITTDSVAAVTGVDTDESTDAPRMDFSHSGGAQASGEC